jgi:sensor histidine kinase YesM
LLFLDPVNNKINIFREEFKYGLSVPAEISAHGPSLVSIKKENGLPPEICIQSGRIQYLLRYGQNPAYPYYYLYYPAVYLSILAFALSIKNIQKGQSRKKYETEKRITELQLALIRNQLDPHFTFNVINSIIYSVEIRENEEASEQLRQFAGLYRNMLLSAGSTRRTIDEELSFCDNYLRLEKLRFKEKFRYNIIVGEGVERNYLIPKFIIQIHAENAIKHGLSAMEKDGLLTIELKSADESLVIVITDNGIGRVRSGDREKSSTGRGLKTLEELFSVYNRYYKEKISSQIIDLYDPAGKPAGTRVCISIRKANEKS